MADIFDEISQDSQVGDVFDQVAPARKVAGQFTSASPLEVALQNILESVPGYGANEAYTEALKSYDPILGNNYAGELEKGLVGTGQALGTIFNPVAKSLGYISKLAHAGGEKIASALVGGRDDAAAILTGEKEQEPFYKFGDTTSTPVNLLADFFNFAQKDPVNAATVLAGGIEGVRNPVGTYKGIVKQAEAGKALAEKGVQKLRESITPEAISRLKTTTDDLLAFTTGAEKTPQLFKASLDEGAFNEVLPDLARAKTSSGVEGVNTARKTLNKETFEVIKPVVRAIDPESPLLKVDSILEKADGKLSLEINTPEVRKPALSLSKKYITGLTPENLLARYNDISDQLITFWKSPDQARLGNRVKALEAVRSVLSDVIKGSLDERGVDPTIWSKYGKTNEFVDQVYKNYINENTAYKSKRGEGILSKKGVQTGDVVSRVPLAGTMIRGASNLIERAKGGTPRLLNKRVDQLFEGIEPSGPILSPPNLNQLLQQVSEDAQANRQLALQRQSSLGLTE